jgi:ABC-2 type transport system permease protein
MIKMNKLLFVIQNELINTFKRPSYLIFAFGIPIAAIIIVSGVKVFQGGPDESGSEADSNPVEYQLEIEGYVDQSGLIQSIPDDLPEGHLIAFITEEAAIQELSSGEISAYYVIPEDYIKKGEVYYVYPDSKPYLSDGQEWIMRRTLLLNLLGGDMDITDRIWNPIWNFKETRVTSSAETVVPSGEDCSRPGFACESNDLVRYLPSIMVLLFFFAFMTSSNMLFNSIGVEKENRTIEVIMTSITPNLLLTGKTIALGFSGLLQMVVWLAAIFILFTQGGKTLSLPEDFTFPAYIIGWSIVFFLGGFAVYASLMAGAGALVPKMKEAGAANFIAIIPLFIGYIVGLLSPIAEVTEASLPVILSFFPLTAPVLMIMRLTDSIVPLWQLLLSAVLLFVSAYFIMKAVSTMFHAQNLLSGQPFSVSRYFQALFGRSKL